MPPSSSSAASVNCIDSKNDVVLASVLDGVLRGGARCVVVLGHSRCDAVMVAIEGWALASRRRANVAEGGGDPSSSSSSLPACCPAAPSLPLSTPSSYPLASASQSPAPSPIKATAATPHHSKSKKRGGAGGFFARLFNKSSSAAASLPSVSPESSLTARRRTSSLERHSQGASAEASRGGFAHGGNENSSHHHQPLAAIADALSGAVDAVARGVPGGRFAKLASSLLSPSATNFSATGEGAGGEGEEGGENGGQEEEGDLSAVAAAKCRRAAAAVALRSQDSIGIAHARFAKDRARVACEEADAEGCVDDVVDEHVRRTVAVSFLFFLVIIG